MQHILKLLFSLKFFIFHGATMASIFSGKSLIQDSWIYIQVEDSPILFLLFGGHKSFLWGHWYPCFGLLVMCSLGFKARGMCDIHFLIYTPLVWHLLTSWWPAWPYFLFYVKNVHTFWANNWFQTTKITLMI